MTSQIAAVVVTYNRKELLRQCVVRLLAQKDVSCDVIVIDNASTDGTDAMMGEVFRIPQVLYENTGRNLGGAGGFEYGVGKAALLGYEYIWMMDDDTLPEETALAELLRTDRELGGRWGFLSSAVYWTDGSICRMNAPKSSIFRRVSKKAYEQNSVPVKMSTFVSLLVKRSIIYELGLPIGAYFIWTDDYEFTGRISGKYPCYMAPESRVIHAMKTRTRTNLAKDDGGRMERYCCLYRNDVHCFRRYGLKGWCYVLLKDTYTVFNILKHAKGNRINRIRIVLRGLREGLRFCPKIKQVTECAWFRDWENSARQKEMISLR